MLTQVDRILVVVRDREAAVATYSALFGAVKLREGGSRALNAHITTVQVGDSEVDLLQPAGEGPVLDFASKWEEGLFGVGFSTPDVAAMARHLDSAGQPYVEEAARLVVLGDSSRGMPVVISADEPREPVGVMRHIYEVTNPVADAAAATDHYAGAFGLDASKFCPIRSQAYGYKGSLTLFDPPNRLDRIEVTQTFGGGAMDRFFQRRGPSLYMSYCETDDVPALAERLRANGARFAQGGDRPDDTGLFVHPSALHGMLMGVSRTNYAWVWSGQPTLAGPGAERYTASH